MHQKPFSFYINHHVLRKSTVFRSSLFRKSLRCQLRPFSGPDPKCFQHRFKFMPPLSPLHDKHDHPSRPGTFTLSRFSPLHPASDPPAALPREQHDQRVEDLTRTQTARSAVCSASAESINSPVL